MTTGNISEMIGFLTEHETQLVPHSNTVFLKHLIGVHRMLSKWDKSEPLCLAGMFHSIYGTEAFEGFSLPLHCRSEIEAMIGPEAEQLVYCFSAFTTKSVFESVHARKTTIYDRFRDRQLHLSKQNFDDLLWLKLADVIEQDERWLALGKPACTSGLAYGWQIITDYLGDEAPALWNACYNRYDLPMIKFRLRRLAGQTRRGLSSILKGQSR